MFDKSEIAKS